MSENKFKISKIELRIDQKCQIIEYYQKNPHLKQTDLIKYFNSLFNVLIPTTKMSAILSASSKKTSEASDSAKNFRYFRNIDEKRLNFKYT